MRSVQLKKSIIAGLRDGAKKLPEDACIYSAVASLVSFYTKRISYPYPQEIVDDKEFHRSMNEMPCKFLYLTELFTPGYPTPFYPSARIGNFRMKNLLVTRLTRDPASPIVSMMFERLAP